MARAFDLQGWKKRSEIFERYWSEVVAGLRACLVAEYEGEFAGYLTIVWESDHPAFRSIPEITDLNVLIKFRRRGVATALLAYAETLIARTGDIAGIRVGLDGDYGAAQRLYVRRGFVPDGLGISSSGRALKYGDQVTVDDDLTLAFTKRVAE